MFALLMLVAMGGEAEDLLTKAREEAVPRVEAEIEETKAALKKAVGMRQVGAAKRLKTKLAESQKELRDLKSGKPWAPVLDVFKLKPGQVGRLPDRDTNDYAIEYQASTVVSKTQIGFFVCSSQPEFDGTRATTKSVRGSPFVAQLPDVSAITSGKRYTLPGIWYVEKNSTVNGKSMPTLRRIAGPAPVERE